MTINYLKMCIRLRHESSTSYWHYMNCSAQLCLLPHIESMTVQELWTMSSRNPILHWDNSGTRLIKYEHGVFYSMDLASNRPWLLIYMMYLSFKTWGLSGPRTACKSVARHNPHTHGIWSNYGLGALVWTIQIWYLLDTETPLCIQMSISSVTISLHLLLVQ